jgi:transposase-like protein
LPKYPTVWVFLHTASTSGYGLSSLITANSMPGFTGSQKRDPELTAQLKRTEEERDILKKAARYFAREPD